MVSVLCYNFEGKGRPKVYLYRIRKELDLKNYKGATVFEDDNQAQQVFQKLKDSFDVDVTIVTEYSDYGNNYITTVTEGVLLLDDLLLKAVEYSKRFSDEVTNLSDEKKELLRNLIELVKESKQ